MIKHSFCLPFSLCILVFHGCGSSSATKASAEENVAVSGVVTPFVLPSNATVPPLTGLSVNIGDSGALLVNPKAAPLASTPLDANASNCTAAGCAWTAAKVNISTMIYGVSAVVQPVSATDGIWQATQTGLLRSSEVIADSNTLAPFTGLVAFAMPVATLDAVAAATGISDADLLVRGLAIGLVLGNTNDTPTAYAALPPPLKGVTATLSAAANFSAPAGSIVYPNDDYTGVTTSGTNADGVFFMIGPQKAGVDGGNINITADDGTHTWTPNYFVATASGSMLIVPFFAGSF